MTLRCSISNTATMSLGRLSVRVSAGASSARRTAPAWRVPSAARNTIETAPHPAYSGTEGRTTNWRPLLEQQQFFLPMTPVAARAAEERAAGVPSMRKGRHANERTPAAMSASLPSTMNED